MEHQDMEHQEQTVQATHKAPEIFKRSTGWLIGIGILFLILGIIGLGMTVSLTIASVLFFGFITLIAGFFQFVEVFTCKSWKGSLWHILIGILYFLIAGIMIFDPLVASTVITAMIASILIIIGVFRTIMGFTINQSSEWGWIVLSGIISMILGTLILAQWPWSGLWVIGLFIAIDLIMNGFSYLLLAFAIKKAPSNLRSMQAV